MSGDGPLPGVPEDATEVYAGLSRALGDIELTQEERDAIGSYVGRELPMLLDSRVTSYLVLGSYRDHYHERLRIVSHELGTRRTDTRAVVLGDTAELAVDERSLPAFPVKFNLLASAADKIVMIMEKESGGEGVELGRLADGPYFKTTYVMPRDYANFTSNAIESLTDAEHTALEIAFNDHLSPTERDDAIERLASQVPLSSCQYQSAEEVLNAIEAVVAERTADEEPPATYSWVHLSDFRKFERMGRCYPWLDEDSLRDQVNAIPGPETPGWDTIDS